MKSIMNKNNLCIFQQIFFVLLSALIYSVAFNFFVVNANLFPGGFSGLSRIITEFLRISLNIKLKFGLLYFFLNLIPAILVYRYVGHRFTYLSIMQFSLVSLFTIIIPKNCVTNDLLLNSVFGGILCGIAISLALKNNASSGGSDFIAIYASAKYNKPTWNYIMIANSIILISAGLLVGWDKALYSIVFQFCNIQVVKNFHDRYTFRTLHIITEKSNEVSEAIFKTVRHGITKVNVIGAYTKREKSYLFLTVNAFQVNQVVNVIIKVDPKAFININITERIVGNYYQTPLE